MARIFNVDIAAIVMLRVKIDNGDGMLQWQRDGWQKPTFLIARYIKLTIWLVLKYLFISSSLLAQTRQRTGILSYDLSTHYDIIRRQISL